MQSIREKDYEYSAYKILTERRVLDFILTLLEEENRNQIHEWIECRVKTNLPREEAEDAKFELFCFFKMQKFVIFSIVRRNDKETLDALTKILDGVTNKVILQEELEMIKSITLTRGCSSIKTDLSYYKKNFDEWSNKIQTQINNL